MHSYSKKWDPYSYRIEGAWGGFNTRLQRAIQIVAKFMGRIRVTICVTFPSMYDCVSYRCSL